MLQRKRHPLLSWKVTPESFLAAMKSANLDLIHGVPSTKASIATGSAKPLSLESSSSSSFPLQVSASTTQGTSRGKKDEKWLAMLEQLVEYKKEHGSCLVPRGYSLNPRLASWIAEQRKQFKLLKDGKPSSMTTERISILNDLGFEWSAQMAAWKKHMSDLKSFQSEHGHCLVPLQCAKYPKLGLWVKEQRRHYSLLKQGKKSHMTEARVQELTELGFTFDTHEAVFLKRLKQLSLYKATFGDCLVPTNFEENKKLGTWCHHQRRQYKKFCMGTPCHITKERVRALNNLGFVWNPRGKGRGKTEESTSEVSSVSSSLVDESESEKEFERLDLRPHKRQRSC
jgi:hypothetical protein